MRFSRNSCGRTRSTSGLVEIVSRPRPLRPGLYRWCSSGDIVLPVGFHRFRQILLGVPASSSSVFHRRFWSYCAAGFAGPRSRRQRVVEPAPTDTAGGTVIVSRSRTADARRVERVSRALAVPVVTVVVVVVVVISDAEEFAGRQRIRTRRLESVSGRARSRADIGRVARGDVLVAS